ncbi:hypothetical protein [Bradyrhizobium sp. USDA 3364]
MTCRTAVSAGSSRGVVCRTHLRPSRGRIADVVEPDPGVDQHEAVIALDQQAVTDHPRPLEDAAAAVHEPLADRAHRAGVEMMDAHDKSSAETDADLPLAIP